MADNFKFRPSDLGQPSRSAFAVTPNDTTELESIPQALYVGTGGTLVVRLMGDSTAVTLTNVPDGALLPIRTKLVLATGTTASGIVALV